MLLRPWVAAIGVVSPCLPKREPPWSLVRHNAYFRKYTRESGPGGCPWGPWGISGIPGYPESHGQGKRTSKTCIYICVYSIYICMHIYVYMYTYLCIYSFLCVYIHVYVYIWHRDKYVCVCICMYIYRDTYVCFYIYTYILCIDMNIDMYVFVACGESRVMRYTTFVWLLAVVRGV